MISYFGFSSKVFNHSEPVKVDLGMALIHLDLDEKVSVLEVNSSM